MAAPELRQLAGELQAAIAAPADVMPDMPAEVLHDGRGVEGAPWTPRSDDLARRGPVGRRAPCHGHCGRVLLAATR